MNKFIPNILKWVFGKYNSHLLKPSQFEGEQIISGLNHRAIIYRDNWHIPHIYAENKQDMFFCQGYIHAQDRYWQMEMSRRLGQGTLAAAFGEEALNTDRLTRTIGFNRLAKDDIQLLNDEHKRFLKAYIDGINSWLGKNKLPIEFVLTRLKPEPWTILDVLAWSRVMTWTLSHGWSGALTRYQIIEKVGKNMAAELAIFYPEDNPSEISKGIDINNIKTDSMYDASSGPYLAKDMEGGGRGSNAWAISSSKSHTGRPVLCNDTHLNLTVPGTWYVNHLFSKDGYHCTGSTMPGFPGILLGHNEHIAWGITLAYTDVEDIFVENINVSNPDQYEYKGKLLEFDIIEESISVKGQSDHKEKVRRTIHGPLIGSVTEHANQNIAICSKSLQPNTIMEGFFNINHAFDWDEFSAGIEKIKSPQLNIVYSDISGNIGLYVSGRVPIRNKGKGDLPVPGWTGEYDWHSEISHADMPHSFNPDCGFIISCNNKITDEKYPYYLGNSFMNGYRAARIEKKFINTDKIDFKLVKQLHLDSYSIPGERLKKGLISEFRTAKPKAQKLINILMDWDCNLGDDTVGGTVYQIFLYTLLKNIVKPHLGEELTIRYLGFGEHPILLPVSEFLGHSTEALFRMFQNPNSKWVPSDKAAMNLIDISLVESCIWLENNMGYESSGWQWGKIHKAEFQHGLAIRPLLRNIFNVGPFSIRGDTDTVHQSAYNPSSPFNCSSWCPSNRFIFDVGNWDDCVAISPPGQSGILGSKHYNNMAPLWLNGDYIPLLWNRDKVENVSKYKLVLSP